MEQYGAHELTAMMFAVYNILYVVRQDTDDLNIVLITLATIGAIILQSRQAIDR